MVWWFFVFLGFCCCCFLMVVGQNQLKHVFLSCMCSYAYVTDRKSCPFWFRVAFTHREYEALNFYVGRLAKWKSLCCSQTALWVYEHHYSTKREDINL